MSVFVGFLNPVHHFMERSDVIAWPLPSLGVKGVDVTSFPSSIFENHIDRKNGTSLAEGGS